MAIYSEFSHEKWWFSIVFCMFTRGYPSKSSVYPHDLRHETELSESPRPWSVVCLGHVLWTLWQLADGAAEDGGIQRLEEKLRGFHRDFIAIYRDFGVFYGDFIVINMFFLGNWYGIYSFFKWFYLHGFYGNL